MSRDQRLNDNWGLLYAQKWAIQKRVPLLILFVLRPAFLEATLRSYAFMLEGLKELHESASLMNIPFLLEMGEPEEVISRLIKREKISLVVTDFSPLRLCREWKERVAQSLSIPFVEVDAHNTVPAWIVSDKAEWGAYTLRPKINRLLDDYLTPFPKLKVHPYPHLHLKPSFSIQRSLSMLEVDSSVAPQKWLKAGEEAARVNLREFIRKRLSRYSVDRNDPNIDGQSGLSPYLHFGQISAARVALEVKKSGVEASDFLEELIVRKELADNFCLYNPHYDSVKGFPDWARRTLREHRRDKRPYHYTLKQLESGATHDPLWNAAERQMVDFGKMHGFLRMYWAKKILEWSPDEKEALFRAIYLNDRYELDGRDPNGYAGIAWAIGGVHDRAFGEREIVGKIRTMTFEGCRRKFDVEKYVVSAKGGT